MSQVKVAELDPWYLPAKPHTCMGNICKAAYGHTRY